MDKQIEIDAYETKKRLATFFRKVCTGSRFTITQRGWPIAELAAYGTSGRCRKPAARDMQVFMREQPPVAGADVKALQEEGRD